MVLDGKMLITGVSYGNATVHVQPKRGCYGSRCDGEVCKILHDPKCPPPHQYLATYYWLEHVQKADVVIHVGTHGSLEFLPGKGTGLSRNVSPISPSARFLSCISITPTTLQKERSQNGAAMQHSSITCRLFLPGAVCTRDLKRSRTSSPSTRRQKPIPPVPMPSSTCSAMPFTGQTWTLTCT